MIKYKIEGEGSRDDFLSSSKDMFKHEFLYRCFDSEKIRLGYNKTWIEFYSNDESIFRYRIDLTRNYRQRLVFYALYEELDKDLKYLVINNSKGQYNSNIDNIKNGMALVKAIQNDSKIGVEYQYTIKGELKQYHFDSEIYSEEETKKIIKNCSTFYNCNESDVNIISKVYNLEF